MIFAGKIEWPYSVYVTPASTATSDLYFDLSLLTLFWNKVRSDGGDIRVFAQGGTTPVAREVSGFDYANKLGSLFIATSGATAFYITCGTGAAEPAPDSTYGKYAVWESAANLVMHCNDLTDSTVNQAVNVSATPPSVVGGKLNRALSFDGSTQKLDMGNVCGLTGNMTVFGWLKATDLLIYQVWFDKSTIPGYPKPYSTYFSPTSGIASLLRGNGSAYGVAYGSASALTVGSWVAVAITQAGTAVNFYSPTIEAGMPQTLSTTIGNGTDHLTIGIPVWHPGGGFKGLMSELRMYSRALSATEIASLVAQHNAPGTFWAIGAGA